jgi:adenosylmethionine-8-amino-7-oxononanoate aminotransferase
MLFETDWFPSIDACRAPDDLVRDHPTQQQRWPSENTSLNQALAEQSLVHLRQQLERDGTRTAAIVIEPIMQGAAGMIVQPPAFLREVAELARAHDVLLIADEVAVGFGRTGTLFACEQDNVTPDILCVAKGLTGGYLPLAATLTTDAIEHAFTGELSDRRTLYHGHTYTGNALACVAAIASLKLFEDKHVIAHATQSAEIITEGLAPLRACRHVLDVRQRGLMVGIELCADRNSRASFDFAARTGAELCRRMRDQGAFVRPLGDVIVLMPAPAMDHATLRRLLAIAVGTILDWSRQVP